MMYGVFFLATSAYATPNPAETTVAAGFGLLLFAILFAVGTIAYFVPTIAAFVNKYPQKVAIFLLNFFAGWTLLGWVGGLVWAFVKPESSVQVVHHYHAPPQPPSQAT